MSNFASRVAVTVVGLPLVLGMLWLGGWWLFLLLALAGLGALHEFYVVARPLRPLVIAGYAGLLATLFGIKLGGLTWGTGGILITFALAFLLKGIAETRQSATVAIGVTVLGAVWVGYGLGYVMLLRNIHPHGRLAAFTVLLAVFAGDTAAFVFGRLFGRHKLAPKVSPGKTWEGFAAGTVATVAVAFFALYKERHHYLGVGEAVALGFALAVVGPLGDLFESAIKRDLNVKDTGRALGGHGGLLDRIDSLLFASVAGFYVIMAFLSP